MSEDRIYKCKDGRTRVYVRSTKKVMSYPKYLVEKTIDRKLEPDEEIHHKDHDPFNNELSNLEIRKHGEHQRSHATKYHDKIVACQWCGKDFLWKAKKQRTFHSNRSRSKGSAKNDLPFCSKSCCGSYCSSMGRNNAGVAK